MIIEDLVCQLILLMDISLLASCPALLYSLHATLFFPASLYPSLLEKGWDWITRCCFWGEFSFAQLIHGWVTLQLLEPQLPQILISEFQLEPRLRSAH